MAWIIAICCCIAIVVVAIVGFATIHILLTQFEYVEETCYEITQDDGINSAVIVEGNEVNTYGTDYNEEEKEVRATENKLRS